MAFTHRVAVTYTTDAGQISSTTNSYTGTGEINVAETLTTGSNTPVALAVDVSAVKSLLIVADKVCTIKTNSTSGDDVIVTKVNIPIFWNTDSLEACPLTVDVDGGLFVTTTSTTALKIRILTDATP